MGCDLGSSFLDTAVRQKALRIWQHLACADAREPCDIIFVMGCSDLRVADRAADLFHDRFAPRVIISGGRGAFTKDWPRTEAETLMAWLTRRRRVPEARVDVEIVASNCLENISYTRELFLKAEESSPKTGIIVTKPYACRRVLATAQMHWPNVDWQITCPPLELADYAASEHAFRNTMSLMVAEVFKLHEYAWERPDIRSTFIPASVLLAARDLERFGFGKVEVVPANFPSELFA